jgi:alpha,alpha-trehalase
VSSEPTDNRAGAAVVVDAGRYAGVVFDMDGVMTDTASVHTAAWAHMFDRYLAGVASTTGVAQQPFSEEDYLRYVDGQAREDGVATFLASRGLRLPRGDPDDDPDVESVWGLANRKNRDFQVLLAAQGVHVFPTSVTFVRELQAAGVGTAIVSASRNAGAVLAAGGIGDLFPVQVDGLEAARLGLPGKPDPAMFVEAARRLGAVPTDAVVVEDAIAGVAAGRAGHFGLVIGVDRAGQADALRAAGAGAVVADLGAVAVTGSRR